MSLAAGVEFVVALFNLQGRAASSSLHLPSLSLPFLSSLRSAPPLASSSHLKFSAMSVVVTVKASALGASADSNSAIEMHRAPGTGAVAPCNDSPESESEVQPKTNNYTSPSARAAATDHAAAQNSLLKLAVTEVDPAAVLMAKEQRVVVFSIHPETARIVAYLAFWSATGKQQHKHAITRSQTWCSKQTMEVSGSLTT